MQHRTLAWFRANPEKMSGSLSSLYRQLGISKQAVWAYARRASELAARLESLLIEADRLREVHGGCGLEKMYRTLKPDWIGRDRFITLLQEFGYGLKLRKSPSRTTYAGIFRYPNLIEGLMVFDINQVWQSDITYIRLGDQFYYAVFIIDIYSKRIVGFELSDHMYTSANLAALRMALRLRKDRQLDQLIHHSDRGSQYGAKAYTQALNAQSIRVSMGTKAQGNAYAERVNGTLKNEYLQYKSPANFDQLKRELSKAVKHYNRIRIHNHLPDDMSPIAFEQRINDKPEANRPFIIVHAYHRPDYNRVKSQKLITLIDMEKNAVKGICPLINNHYFFHQNGQR